MVSILAFYSEDQSLNPAGYLLFSTVIRKDKLNEKDARVGSVFLKKVIVHYSNSVTRNFQMQCKILSYLCMESSKAAIEKILLTKTFVT